ncbi:hypothetical protein VDG1235_574 [Verrucomicrobiia bacterium DG1235]|nr:hypothetical protein VDG1235_574 [Verrucomicrobiae bacterium DG1235]
MTQKNRLGEAVGLRLDAVAWRSSSFGERKGSRSAFWRILG